MAKVVQFRRGTTTQNNKFTGAPGEVTMDMTAKTLRVHDGKTLGGVTLARKSDIPNITDADYVVAFQLPTPENGYTWYRKYKSGWVEQGQRFLNINHSTPTIIPLPVPMANHNYIAEAYCEQIDTNVTFGSCSTVSAKSHNSTNVCIGQYNTVNAPMTVGWQVKGMAA